MRLLIVFIICLFFGCASVQQRQAKCPKRAYKQKNYRVKKQKSVARPPYTGGYNARATDLPDEIEAAGISDTTEIVSVGKRQQTEPESSGSIPDLKAKTIPDLSQEVVEFRGEEVNLEEGFSFDEEIPFVVNSNYLINPIETAKKINDLKKFLKNNPDLVVTVIGNTASDTPDNTILYGDSPSVLNQVGTLNGKLSTTGEVMTHRAERIKNLLVSEGIDPSQIKTKTGSHRKWARERVVTFTIKKKGEDAKVTDTPEERLSSANEQEQSSSIPEPSSTEEAEINSLDELVKVVEASGEEANNGFEVEESILFIANTDQFRHPEVIEQKTKEVIRYMRDNPTSKIIIYGNTASEGPDIFQIYGSSKEAKGERAKLNGMNATIGELMMARARSIQNLLISRGVQSSQIQIKSGSHRRYPKDRKVTFILHDSEFKPKQKEIEYRGLSVPSNYKFHEQTLFNLFTDQLSDENKTRQILNELTNLLNNNPKLNVSISSNTFSEGRIDGVLYGGSDAVLNQQTTLNGNTVTLRETMIAQGNTIKQLLIAQGVNANQVTVKPGKHLYDTYGQRTQFVIQ